ncbi:MAG: hypothetical protein EKK48_08145 [Candidatus Melainabacteria bacterium]|nr:MAG: hypothetical protein EKK48_08145 [Candidatus Melainabacteria bacterium]
MSENNFKDQEYLSLTDCWRIGVGTNKELVYCPTTQATHVLSSNTVRLLRECTETQTLDLHAARLCERFNIPLKRFPEMRQQLNEFVNGKLLVSKTDLLTMITEHSSPQSPLPKIASLAVPTRNRPQVFRRCLDSYAECAKLYDRNDLTLLAMDQSDTSDLQQENQQAIESVRKNHGIKCLYSTARNAEILARDISSISGVAPDVVNFALINDDNMPQAHGLSRNFLLLSTVGDLTVQVDDDTICSVLPCREFSFDLTLTSQYAPQQFWFLSKSETETFGDAFTREDFFALHEQLLGRSVASCVNERCSDDRLETSSINFEQISSEFFHRLTKPGGRVAITSLGVGGEAGMEGSSYFLTADRKSRARMMKSESDYRFTLNSNQILRSVTSETISSGSVITGHNQGFDNRNFLPPYFPLWRGEDMAFGELLGQSDEGAFNGYMPWHLLHKPFIPRNYSAEHLRLRASRLSFGAIMEALLQSLKNERRRTPKQSIEAIGRSLLDWGKAPLAEFEEMLTLQLLNRVSIQLLRLETELKQNNKTPAYWAADIEMCMNALRQTVVKKTYIVGRDLEDYYGLDTARKTQQKLVRRFGELLISWSAIRDAAIALRKNMQEREV